MRNLFDYHFTLRPGTKVYVPTEHGREIGATIKKRVEGLWKGPRNYFHLRNGGHVAAARLHKDQPWIASMDLKRFFEQISRSRVQRSLLRIGMAHADAYEMACDSVVDKAPPNREFSIPFGFVQSPILASLALAHSALGTELDRIRRSGLRVSVYVDDITISGDDNASLVESMAALDHAARTSNFELSDQKTQGPASEVTSFNIRFGSGRMEIIEDRMAEFEAAIRYGSEWVIGGVLGYVGAVNEGQADALTGLLGANQKGSPA
ncbi:reverse transcriptase domain-containing protein [Aurantiacibacter gangjinensis]|uniref:reverse transcriptase domain-containing protein n=1 Tax=Aurantiacibacter gangjinensis TaxID=502682 RepID=UPI00138E2BCF|nr:reverse transcriptase domain-containing protein [Aurantiacibacter gangjinensis]